MQSKRRNARSTNPEEVCDQYAQIQSPLVLGRWQIHGTSYRCTKTWIWNGSSFIERTSPSHRCRPKTFKEVWKMFKANKLMVNKIWAKEYKLQRKCRDSLERTWIWKAANNTVCGTKRELKLKEWYWNKRNSNFGHSNSWLIRVIVKTCKAIMSLKRRSRSHLVTKVVSISWMQD